MKQYWLVVRTSTGGRPLCLPLHDGEITIGRGGGCDIIIPDKKISRLHYLIRKKDDQVQYEDRRPSGRHKKGTLLLGSPLLIHDTEIVLVDDIDVLLSEDGKKNVLQPQWADFTAFLIALRQATDVRTLLDKLLLGLASLFKAERGYVLLREAKGAPLEAVASHLLDNVNEFVKVSSTIANRALKSDGAILIENTKKSQLCVEALSLMETGPRTVMCCPLVAGNSAFGVIYLDRASRRMPFMSSEVKLFESATGLAAGILAERKTRQRLLLLNKRLSAISTMVDLDEEIIIGAGSSANELKNLIHKASEQDVSVLITGETGTGKEMVARTLHRLSSRRANPFVAVNCAALPYDVIEAELFGCTKGAFTGASEERMGRFELASSGTLFLDEVGELPIEVQVKLLRVLQGKTITRLGSTEEISIDFRLLCATNRNLEEAVRKGTFRKDLFYRINVFKIPLLPLRKREEQIVPLAKHFLIRLAKSFGKKVNKFTPGALKLLTKHNWPGNIRELKNAIERAIVVAKGDTIKAANLPISPIASAVSSEEALLRDTLPTDYKSAKEAFERAFLKRAIDEAKGNITKAAKATGMTRYTIYRRLEKLGMIKQEETE